MTFEELCAEHGIPTRTEREGWVQIQTCPGCRRQWYLGYNTRGGYFNCWKCGKLPYRETLAALGVPATAARGLTRPRRSHVARPTGTLSLPTPRGPLGPAHRNYLRARGFDPATIVRLWEVEGLFNTARLRWRIFMPIHYRHKTVSWTTRAITENTTRRYISAGLMEEAMPHKELLYGEDYVRHGIVICEGPLDAWAIGPGAVATLGTAYSRAQVLRMVRYPVRAICFDSEAGAQRRARKLMDELCPYPGVTCNLRLDAKDAATAPKRDIRLIRKQFLEVG